MFNLHLVNIAIPLIYCCRDDLERANQEETSIMRTKRDRQLSHIALIVVLLSPFKRIFYKTGIAFC